MKKILKCLVIILVVLILGNIYELNNNKCYAVPFQEEMLDEEFGGTGIDVTQNPSLWDPRKSGSSDSSFESKISGILGAVQAIGVIVSVGTLAVIGIKFMVGSVEEKAQYKQTLLPWLLGAIMVFAMTSLPTFIYNVTKGLL